MSLKKYLIYFLFILFYSCFQSNIQKDLGKDNLIKRYFSNEEVSEISDLILFFENNLKEDTKENKLDNIYKSFYLTSLKKRDSGITYLGMDRRKKEQLPLFNISKPLFNKIWSYGFEFKDKDTIKSVFIDPSKQYVKFLDSLGTNYSYINDYSKSIKNTYDISPHEAFVFLNNYKNINLDDPKIRFFIAIHYITLFENSLTKFQ